MKKIFTRLTRLLVFLLFPGYLFAQEKDFNLMLNSGKFIPPVNISSLNKGSDVFQKSLFNSKHYVTIQFSSLPTEAMKAQLKGAGIELLDYIPNNAYNASVSNSFDIAILQNFSIRSVVMLNAAQKTTPDVLTKSVPQHAINASGYADVDIMLYENLGADNIASAINALGATIIADVPVFRMFTIRIPKNNLPQLAAMPFVQWTEYIAPPNQPENLPGRSLHRVSVLNDGVRNLKGDGMNIGVWDERASQHLDFSPAGRLINVDAGAAGSHGTHVSGTIGSRGLINPLARGMAPNATIYSYYGFSGDVQVTMSTAIPANTLISSNHSYHDGLGVQCGLSGASVSYSLRARNTDINLNNFPYHLHCHSAGNNQSACASGWGTITGTGKAAKNNLVVASITSFEAMTSYSSFGPVHDGRIKPEISAMGDGVFSTYTPLNTYGTISGTSMSTPGITGTVALLAQRYKQLNGNVLPPSSLIKNIACNTAQDLGNPGPDYRFGFGRINALAAVRILEENRYAVNTIATGANNDITITVPAGAARLRVMLTWNDPAAAANASAALVNNLDLRVIEGANTYLPWILNPTSPATNATQADDNISNIEQVTVNNPASGTYTLRVNGEAVPTGPNQTYSLTWDIQQPYIEVIYPNGGESFSPGTTQVVTWDNAGVAGTQTVEYSLDNGSTWVTIGTVAATVTRLSWSVPAGANTSTALIRVTSGAITDNSDVTFKILGTTTGFSGSGVSCNAGEVIFNWTGVTNATHYDIYRLDPATGDFIILAPNVTGTTYTATSLTPNTSMWFTIRAKNNTTGSVSERANAINVTVSNGGGGLGAVGTISGQTAVCGAQTGVPYSIAPVAGATSYTWTVPAGATIASGQGTTNITVNYTGGNSGNISVYASNGSCQTAPNTLPITSGNAAAAPTSGGNQSQTVCPGGTVPTLTATATPPASGYTVVWYNAASGGSVVSSPTLNAVGTATYYAASNETATGCESTNRTPVVLTINSVAAASATAGGATTFCQGNSVVLTANAGSSYVWNNNGTPIGGATSQSYTAITSGSYTVTVTNGACTSTSNAITVTANSNPAANVSASGATTFCQGNNVVLTASAGSSWSWSNGATTQSITVTNSGNYSVTVSNTSGCSASSAMTTVAVSPSPLVTISAAPYTRLYPGLITTLTANVTPPGSYTYVWRKNGNVVTGASASTLAGIDLDDLGSYTVTITNTTGLACSNTSAALAISDSATSKIFILPNPNDGEFDVVYYSAGSSNYTLTLFDGKGAMIYSRPYSISSPYQRMHVNIKQHGRGIYQVVLTDKSGKRIANGKVLIQ